MKYEEYLKTDHWKRISKKTKDKAGNKCQLCSASGELHAHHRTYEHIGDEQEGDLICLCAKCHEKFHDKAQEVDYIEPMSDVAVFVREVKNTLIEFEFYGMEQFSYWASYVRQNEIIYQLCNDEGFEAIARDACPTNTAMAIQESVWDCTSDTETKNKLRDLSFLPHRRKEIEF